MTGTFFQDIHDKDYAGNVTILSKHVFNWHFLQHLANLPTLYGIMYCNTDC